MRITRVAPSQMEEAWLYKQGYSLIAGIDEAGRGPLAGPVVAATVVLPRTLTGKWVSHIRDSKELTAPQREYVFHHLEEKALSVGVGQSDSGEVDTIGIVAATRLAMSRAITQMPLQPQFLLIDALPLPDVPIPQKPIVHGDSLCLSIAAASIVAKVTRDGLMKTEDEIYPTYGFRRHKGYGTREHLRNLRLMGPCPIHRCSFAPVRELLDAGHA